jgi:asparagine synthase (glutamine-hydrolysing)
MQLRGEPRVVLDPRVLDRMTDVMTHRGPDDRGTYQAAGVALGMRRLSIVDVAGGHQPVFSEDGSIVAIQNGELYNHEEIRKRLRADGHRFETRCDTEILPHLYERHGPGFPRELRGMFGVAIWDGRERRLVLARDRLGIKPLYYAQVGDLLVFASELKSLLASGLVDGELDHAGIDAYLTLGFFPGPHTPLAGVAKLMPGEVLTADAKGLRVDRYWTYPEPSASGQRRSLEEHEERLLDELETSVRLRLMSDVPLGAMLSGGIDSSLIVALMARNMTEPVNTFSIGFVEDEAGNELDDARLVANAFGAQHHELELSFTDQAIDLDELVWFLDEPIADVSTLGFLLLSELASRHVTVALSGQGADELFGGYRKHRAAALVGAWSRVPRPLRAVGTAAALHGPARFRRAAETLAAPDHVTRLLAMSGQLPEGLRQRLYTGALADLASRPARDAVAARLNGVQGDPLAVTLYLDGQLALVDTMLHYFDRASMAHSLEVRVPFLDHKFVEYAATIPSGMKVHRLETKYLLRKAARGVIPDRILDKPKIGFFRAAEDAWLRAQLDGALGDYLMRPDASYTALLDAKAVHALASAHTRRGTTPHARLLLGILMLEVWLSSYLPRALAGSKPRVGVAA